MSHFDDVRREVEEINAARLAWPALRAQQLEAGQRLLTAILKGDMEAGSQALADAIAAQAAMLAAYRGEQHA